MTQEVNLVACVFSVPNNTAKSSYTAPKPEVKSTMNLEGAWKVAFQQGRGAPAAATFDKLESYTSNANEGIKYFSGTATYTKTVEVPAGMLSGGKVIYTGLPFHQADGKLLPSGLLGPVKISNVVVQ